MRHNNSKSIMFRRLKNQLLIAFLAISFFSLVQAIINIQLSKRKEQAENISLLVHALEINVLEQAKSINDFFTYETCKEDFFNSKFSHHLNIRNKLQKKYSELTTCLYQNTIFKKIDKTRSIENLTRLSDSLNRHIDSITFLIHQRGFKDYGIEGEMRMHAHQIERSNCVDPSEILMLRRHEKDYIIRNEQKYIDKFNNLIIEILAKSKSGNCSKEIILYKNSFNKMVEIDRIIGVKDNSALRLKLDRVITAMMFETQKINGQCNEYRTRIYQNIKTTSIGIFILIMCIGLLLSILLSKLITKRITLLTRNISTFVKSGFTINTKIDTANTNDEIGLLINNFEIMRTEIIDQINHLEKTVTERTEEINTQKEHILKQNRKMRDSIKYAKNLQEAMLPTSHYIAETIPNHFIFFQPKDIVSGDFYWYRHIKNERFDVTVLAVADCTGHGVPGGLMSMLGIASLSEICVKKDVQSASDILDQLRIKISETFSTKINGQLLKDGMDIAIVVLDHANFSLQFAGAYRPLYFIRNNELVKIKGDCMPIGRYHNNNSFTLHKFELKKNDLFYLCTDGFVDQHSKTHNKKYLEKNFKELLQKISTENLNKQKNILETEFANWKSDTDQTDDILIVGFKIQ